MNIFLLLSPGARCRRVALGLVVALDYKNPYLSPFQVSGPPLAAVPVAAQPVPSQSSPAGIIQSNTVQPVYPSPGAYYPQTSLSHIPAYTYHMPRLSLVTCHASLLTCHVVTCPRTPTGVPALQAAPPDCAPAGGGQLPSVWRPLPERGRPAGGRGYELRTHWGGGGACRALFAEQGMAAACSMAHSP